MAGWKRLLTVALAAGALTAALASTELGFAPEEPYGLDPLFRLRGPLEPPSDVVVVRRDAETYSWLQRLPRSITAWPEPLAGCVARYPDLARLRSIDTAAPPPRTLYACVLDQLRRAEAATIVFDVAFQRRQDEAESTRALAAAMRAHGRVLVSEFIDEVQPTVPAVVAPLMTTAVEPTDRILHDAAVGAATFLMPNPDGTRFARQFWIRHGAMPQPLQLPVLAVELSMSDGIEQLGRRAGWSPDPDMPWLQRNETAVAAILAASDGGNPVTADDPLYRVWQRLERTRRGPDYLYFNLYGPAGTIRSVSFASLLGSLNGPADGDLRSVLKGATVFVGYAELGNGQQAYDHFSTAFNKGSIQLSGVELGATAFANLRDGNAIRALPDYERLPLSFAIGGTIAAGAAAGTLWFGFALASAVALAWVALAVVSFVLFGWWLPVVLPVAVLFAAALCGAAWRSHVMGEIIDDHFPAWLRELLKGGNRQDPHGKERPVVVLFTDMVGSTKHTEALEARGPAVIDAFRERHFEILDGAIVAHGGDLYSFTGDGRQAGWGYPVRHPDDAVQACKAALAIEAALAADNAVRVAQGELPVRVRIGIHAGPGRVIVIGKPPGVTFALTGNTVNAASKVEQIGKTLVTDQPVATILATEAVVAQTGDTFAWEAMGEHSLGGRTEVSRLFRLRGLRRAALAASLLLLGLVGSGRAGAAEPCPADRPAVAWIVAEEGNVSAGGRRVRAGFEPAVVCADDIVDVGPDSRATLTLLGSNTTASLDGNSIVRLPAPPEPESGVMQLVRGTLFFISQVRRRLTIETAYSNAGIVGTEVLVAIGEGDEPRLDLRVFEGAVAMSPAAGPLAVRGLPDRPVVSGERLVVGDDLVARLEQPVEADAVQLRAAAARALSWTLYYPPLFPPGAAVVPPLREASRLLAAGQADAARAVLQRIADGSADAGLRDALLAVVAVTQGDPQAGLALADTAVRRRPDAAAPLLARSFAEQALRHLDDARASARAATEVEPGDALAWARLAEVELMFGATRASRDAADRAVELGPTALVRVVQGFARLAAFDIDGARASFAAALDLDSGQPLAHLGLGLASIRRNDMEAGTRSLEIAAGLDPAQSLLRSYLGKAYFTDFRDKAAARQYAIAKQLDPTDPTPWLYDAIRKQLDNRPVEALRDLETSIALNDNRAMFRSGLLLDGDRAVRGASLAGIYRDLGYLQAAVNEARKSINIDPTNTSAHNFLAEAYTTLPRYEFARLSETLQAQMLQGPNITPVRPSLAVADITAISYSSPSSVSFNEYTPLFQTNGLHINSVAGVGNNEAKSAEVTLSGLADRFSLSAGQYASITNGNRSNAQRRQYVTNLYSQYAPSAQLNLQAEYIRRNIHNGDINLSFDEENFDDSYRLDVAETLGRIGTRYSPNPEHDLLLSLMYVDTEFQEEGMPTARERGPQIELQHLWKGKNGTLVSGVLLSTIDMANASIYGDCCVDGNYEDYRTYSYLTHSLTGDLSVILGLDALKYRDDALHEEGVDLLPKVGIVWQPNPKLDVRAAAFKVRKPKLLVGRSLEPTQLAGFNQIFDDPNGTTVEKIGFAIDYNIGPARYAGTALTVGWLDVPRQDFTPLDDEPFVDPFVAKQKGTEIAFSSYFNYALSDDLVLNLGVDYSLVNTDADSPNSVDRVATLLVPVELRFAAQNGFFGALGLEFVRQNLRRPENFDSGTLAGGDEDVLLVSASLGYRLPSRRGIISAEARNILDENFRYQDESYRSTRQSVSSLPLDRTLFLQLTLFF